MKKAKLSTISAIVLLAVLLLAGCAGGQFEEQSSSPSVPATQSDQSTVETHSSTTESSTPSWDLSPRHNDAGQVGIDVQPSGLDADQESWEFSVALNTHSVNLDYDLTQVTVLRCERGEEYKPVSWEGSPSGGHHRQGVLHFTPLDHPSSFIEIVIKDVADVPERVFHWEAGPTI